MKIDGVAEIKILKADGRIETIKKHNMIVDSGFDFMCEAIGNGGVSNMSKIMVGDGTSDTTADMTALENKVAEKAATYNHTTGTKVFTMQTDFGVGEATGALTEAGVFNADGTMLDRVTFKVANIEDDDKISVTFQFTLS